MPVYPLVAHARRSISGEVAAFPRAFWVLWVGTLVNRLGLVVLPFLTLYLTGQRGLSTAQAAGVVALYGAGAFAANLAGGALADRIGRRRTMLASLLGGAAAVLAVPLADGLPALGGAVAGIGLFGEMYRPAVSASVADLVPPERRARAYALLYWVINLGAAVAPAVGGLLATRSYAALFVLDAATMAGYALIVSLGVPETRPAASPPPAGPTRARPLAALADPALATLTASAFLVVLLFFQAFTTLPLAMRADGLSAEAYGAVIAMNGALIVALSLVVARWAERRPPALVLAAAAAVIGLGFGLHAPASTAAGYALAIAVWTLGEMALSPVAPAVVARLAPPERRGAYQGTYGAAWGLGALVGPALGGLVLDRWGPTALWTGCAAVGLAAAAGFLLLGRSGDPRLTAPAPPPASG